MILSISEILEKISKLKSFEEKVSTLQASQTPALIWVLKICFHPDIKTLLPEGPAPYRPSEYPDNHGALRRDYRKLAYFFSNQGYDNIRKSKREVMFVELLETIDKEDAKLLVAIKDKKMPYKGITYRLVETAYPGLLPSTKVEKKEDEHQENVQA